MNDECLYVFFPRMGFVGGGGLSESLRGAQGKLPR